MINGGFFVMNQKIFDYIDGKKELEDATFRELSAKKQITAYRHSGFWKCMNVFKDVVELNELWSKKKAKWKVW